MTELNAVVSSSLADILAINENVAALLEEAKTKRQAAVEPFLEALAQSGEVSVIVVRGYTPGFNDGEPCEHSAEYWVNLQQAHEGDLLEDDGEEYNLGLEFEEDEDGFQAENAWDAGFKNHLPVEGARESNEALAAKLGHKWAPPSAEILNAIQTLLFTTVEEEEGTDYWVSYVLKDGKFVKDSGEYDCGY